MYPSLFSKRFGFLCSLINMCSFNMENDILDTLEDLGYAYTSLRVSLLNIAGYPSVSLC